MTLPLSPNPISTAQILTELNRAGPVNIPTDADVRALTGIASGPIRIPNDFWGKSSQKLSTTLHAQADGLGSIGYANWALIGDGSAPFGSMDSYAVAGGYTVAFLYELFGSINLGIVGFAADPGQGFFTNLSLAGNLFPTAGNNYIWNANAYGQASWQWAGQAIGIGAGGSYAALIL